MWLNRSSDGRPRSLRKALKVVDQSFRPAQLTGRDLDQAAEAFGRALVEALDHDPALAVELLERPGRRLPAEGYAAALGPERKAALHEAVGRGDRTVLGVIAEAAGRAGDLALEREAGGRLAVLAGERDSADDLVSLLRRRQDAGLLDLGTTTHALRAYTARAALAQDAAVWSAFFDHLADPLVPDLYPVKLFLGRGGDAARLADNPVRKREALECCAASQRLDDVLAGLELARTEGLSERTRDFHERAGELLLAAGRPAEALAHCEQAGRHDLVSRCHERLGDRRAALATCPAEEPDRLAALAAVCHPDIDDQVQRGDRLGALGLVSEILGHLERAVRPTERIAEETGELEGLRAAVGAVERRRLGDLLGRATPADRPAVYLEWSRFEEAAGRPAEAAGLAEDAGDLYRAHALFRKAERFGDADRVLKSEDSAESRAARAASREAGGDLLGAARLHEQDERYEEAVDLYGRADDASAAARCLIRGQGEEAIEDPRLAPFLRRTGNIAELVERCLDALERRGRDSAAAGILTSLVEQDDAAVPELQRERVSRALQAIGAVGRKEFEERAAEWARQARADTHARFADVWGLDLGTHSCVAALYDTDSGRPVICPDGVNTQFASTLTVTESGEEIVGLSGDQILAPWVVGHISASKRRMGDGMAYTVLDRSYRPEEVAARLIAHARTLVEKHLAAQVRERLGELARAELGQVRDEWLDWAAEHHDLTLEREEVIVTIPAYFRNNAKHATRSACDIAGVKVRRLIHEPTAACLAAAAQRRLSGEVTVVDLGAGTLDVSAMEVQGNRYQVRNILGDNEYGGYDFDRIVADELARRLRARGLDVPATGRARRRLELAAEHLKIALSSQPEAEYILNAYLGQPEVRLELTRDELATLLADSLGTLRTVCERMTQERGLLPDHLVLVGGPMLSPLISKVVEEVFEADRTVLSDPRTAVAYGAALEGAVISGHLTGFDLHDATPFDLGIAVAEADGAEGFSILIPRNTRIPNKASKTYTTTRDLQSEVLIRVYIGRIEPRSLVGVLRLTGIPPLARGVPQIEVTFGFDKSCVLTVTARDTVTGNSSSAEFTETTLLAPGDIETMSQRHTDQRELEELGRTLHRLVEEAAELGDCEPLCREFRERLSAHRPARRALDPTTQGLLAEMYGPQSAELESELLSLRAPLRDLLANARSHLAQPLLAERTAAGQHLARQLAVHLAAMRQGMARLTRWNGVLAALAAVDSDPLTRFRALHAAGDHGRALQALEELAEPLTDPEDLRRRLHCLAGAGDVEGYRRTLLADAARLGAVVLDPANPGDSTEFTASARAALVRVADGSGQEGDGFLISDRHVLTSRRWAAQDPEAMTVRLVEGERAVRRVFLADSSSIATAVLLLAEPVRAAPLRLGFPRLVHIGDLVWAAEPDALAPGTVEKFEVFPEQRLQLFKIDLTLPADAAGGPLFNELGEVIGTLALRAESDGVFAVSTDSLAPLLVSAGFGLTGAAGGDGR
ncbi:Hsp70 family protein [Streptomyces sp. NPDC092307]|uniref:Hsp70 family protein n=1 Tax=Streptomyces sp. NPDC092307 TaxID=3366013 RepID=UPI003830A691